MKNPEPAISFLEAIEDFDPWAKAEYVVSHLAREASAQAESAPEAKTAYAYGIFRAKVEREITALLERIRDLEEHLEGGLT